MKNFTMLYEVNLIKFKMRIWVYSLKLEGIPLEIQTNFKQIR